MAITRHAVPDGTVQSLLRSDAGVRAVLLPTTATRDERALGHRGYQGDQCDLRSTRRSAESGAHTTAANVPDLRRFVLAVLAFTGASEVDIVGHTWACVSRASGCARIPTPGSWCGASSRSTGRTTASHPLLAFAAQLLAGAANGGFTPKAPSARSSARQTRHS
jgi:hypothetical protein